MDPGCTFVQEVARLKATFLADPYPSVDLITVRLLQVRLVHLLPGPAVIPRPPVHSLGPSEVRPGYGSTLGPLAVTGTAVGIVSKSACVELIQPVQLPAPSLRSVQARVRR